MVMCHDENADHNVEMNPDRKTQHYAKPTGAPANRPLGSRNARVSEGGLPGDTDALKFGPSFQEWAARKLATVGSRRKEGGPRFEAASPLPAAGRQSGTPRSNKRHFSSTDTLVHMGCEDAEQTDSTKEREEVLGAGHTMVFSTSILSDVDAAWSQSQSLSHVDAAYQKSLREVVPPQPYKAQTTVPRGFNFRTPNRSRSASVRSCTPDCATPEVCDTPRGRTLPWEQSLRGRAPAPGVIGRAASVDHTPRRQKRRSLSHWWAESSAPPKVACHSDLSLDADDAISDTSVEPHHTDPVTLLNRMPQRSKRLSVERKRAQLAREQLPSESPMRSCTPMVVTDLGSLSNGNQNWMRSLRQGRSCPPPMLSARTRGREPSFHTVRRARSRAASHSTERFVMGESEHLHPRQRSALDKYLERARSCSTGHSARATPERHAGKAMCSGKSTPREQTAVESHLERLGVRGRSAQRSTSATPERPTSSGCCPFNGRERSALQKHLERIAARSCSAQRSASATPERQTATKCQARPTHERSAIVQNFKSQLKNHLEKHLEKHLERAAEAAAAGVTVEAEPVPASHSSPNELAECNPPVATSVAESAPAAPVVTSKVLVETSKSNVDKEWVRKATNPEERAERARAATQTKLEQALVHQRNRVCVFKRRSAAAAQ